MNTKEYDVIFIGAGGAAYPGAFYLGERGKKVLMFDEKGNLGGDCLYAGCIPSKAVRSEIMRALYCKELEKNLDKQLIWNKAIERKEEVQDIRYKQHEEEIKEHYPNVDFYKAKGEFLSAKEILVKTESEEFVAKGKYIVIATGSETIIPPIENANTVLTSNELFSFNKSIKTLPDSLIIIGSGYIGLEVAGMLAPLGVKVTIIKKSNNPVLSNLGIDNDLSNEIVEDMKKLGVDIIFEAPLKSIKKINEKYLITYVKNSKEYQMESSQILLAIGRKPRLKGYGLEKTGVKVEGNAIAVNEYLQTNIPGIYATGDVTGKAMLFHSAVKQSMIAAQNILHEKPVYTINYNAIPFTVFTMPEIAKIGLSEKECMEKGIAYKMVKKAFSKDAQAQIVGERRGFIKILYDPRSYTLIGAEIYSHNAAELIAEFTLAMEGNMTAKQLAWTCNPHPLSFEYINYVLREIF